MKKIVLLFFTIIFSLNVFSQSLNWQWAKRIGGTNVDAGWSVAVDASGNTYTSGSFIGTVDFDPGSGVFNLTSANNAYDIFISKLNVSGNLVWAKRMGGMGADISYSIAVDASGNVYTTGWFQTTADFDPGAGIFNLIPVSDPDIFISKLDTAGNFVWAKSIDALTGSDGRSIVVDAFSNIYITGRFTGMVDFDPGPGIFNLTSAGAIDIFICKLDGQGNFVWAKAMGGAANDMVYSIAIDAGNGDVYTTGTFLGTADFDPGPGVFNLTCTAATFQDIFISKLDTAGNFVWAKAMGGTNYDYSYSLAIDPAGSGDIYITGAFWGTSDLDPGPGIFNLTSAGTSDIFICKLDSAGNFIWAKAMGGTGNDFGYAVALDPTGTGNIYSTGYFLGTADFDPGPGIYNLTSSAGGNSDIFISKLDNSGNFVWATAALGAGTEYGHSMVMDASGNLYVAGEYNSSLVSFGSITLGNGGQKDIFIAKMIQSTVGLPIELISFQGISNGSVVDLTWTTASEINNDYFTVERSRDAQQFEQVGIVDGAGNSSQALNYFFTDMYPVKGLSYYRLMQTDFDGTYSYSNTIAVNFGSDEVNIFFNPAASQLTIISGAFAISRIEVYSTLGEKVFSQPQTTNHKLQTVDVSQLLPGIYFITITDQAGNKVTKKVVKM